MNTQRKDHNPRTIDEVKDIYKEGPARYVELADECIPEGPNGDMTRALTYACIYADVVDIIRVRIPFDNDNHTVGEPEVEHMYLVSFEMQALTKAWLQWEAEDVIIEELHP